AQARPRLNEPTEAWDAGIPQIPRALKGRDKPGGIVCNGLRPFRALTNFPYPIPRPQAALQATIGAGLFLVALWAVTFGQQAPVELSRETILIPARYLNLTVLRASSGSFQYAGLRHET
ncbi:MAG: hypothetical protein ACP5I4_12245, partial [Oceanipulchritudo sp.]